VVVELTSPPREREACGIEIEDLRQRKKRKNKTISPRRTQRAQRRMEKAGIGIKSGDFGGQKEDEGSGSMNVSYKRPGHKAPPGVTSGRSVVP
jgi:hypothetical protein